MDGLLFETISFKLQSAHYMQGFGKIAVEIAGANYECDFGQLSQTKLSTQYVRKMRFKEPC